MAPPRRINVTDQPKVVERTIMIEAEPSVVFEALTSEPLVTCWLCHEAKIDGKPGGEFLMAWRATDSGRTLRYEGTSTIEAFDSGERLSLRMQDGAEGRQGSLVSFVIEPSGSATKLTLSHSGFGGHADGMRRAYERGWSTCLDLLRSLLEDSPERRLLMATMYRDLPSPGDEPCGLAWDGERILLSEASTGKIYTLDPITGHDVASIPYEGEPADMTWDGTHVWQADAEKRALVRIDRETGSIAATLRVPRDEGEITGLTWDGSGMWVSVAAEEGELLRLDGKTGDETCARPASAGVGGLAWDGTWLWAGDINAHSIACVDPQTGAVQCRIAVKGTPMGLCWDGDRIWYVDREWNFVSKILDLPQRPNL
jgi:uncharacterized protein YndB with AHSA1/START domain